MQILMYFQLAPPPFSCNSRFPQLAQDGVVRNVILYFTVDNPLVLLDKWSSFLLLTIIPSTLLLSVSQKIDSTTVT